MKVLSIQPTSKRGGPSIQHLNFIRATKDLGVEHHVFLPENHQLLDEYQSICAAVRQTPQEPGTPAIGIVPRSISPLAWIRYIARIKSLSLEISQYATSNGINLIWTLSEAFPAGPIAASKCNIHSATQFFGMTSYKPRIAGLLITAFHRKYSDIVIPCQKLIKNDLVSLGYPAQRVVVVHNGVDTDKIASATKDRLSQRSNDDKLIVTMIAGLDRRKGHLQFIQAAKYLVETAINFEFNIIGSLAGDDSYLKELRSAIDENNLQSKVFLRGAVPVISDWLTASHIFVVPSKIEALSVAGLEAMAAELPIVATDVGGNSVAVLDSETGYLCKPNSAEDLARKVQLLCESATLRETYGTRGKQHAEQFFSLSAVAVQLTEAFRVAVNTRNK